MIKSFSSQMGRTFAKHRQWWIIGAVAIMITLVGGYVWMSYQYWQVYPESLNSEKSVVKKHVKTILSSDIAENNDRKKVLKSLQYISKTKEEVGKGCDVTFVYQWQQLFSSLKKSVNACQKEREKIELFGSQVDAVARYLVTEQKLSRLFEPVMGTEEFDENIWQGQEMAWRKVSEEIAKTKAEKNIQPLRDLLKDRAISVASQWQALYSAHKKEDKKAFEDTVIALDKAYLSLRADQESQTDKILQPLLVKVDRSYKNLF